MCFGEIKLLEYREGSKSLDKKVNIPVLLMDERLRQVQMGDRCVERYPTALPVSDMQIKTTARHHYAPTRVVKNNKTDNIKIQGNRSSTLGWGAGGQGGA